MATNVKLMASEEYVDGKVDEKYTKPDDGIPKDDLAESVQASLGKADTALQEHQDITGKADKSTTYTKTEVDAIVQALKTGSRQIVETLPASGQPMVIYMVAKSASQTNNAYDEYIWTAAGAWEKIGDTEIDLSGYYTKTATNTLLAAKQDTISDLAAIRSGAAAGATAYQKPSGGIPKTDLSSDFVQIGENNEQPWEYDVALGPAISPLFTAVAGYDDPMNGWTQMASADFGAELIQMNGIIGQTSLTPDYVSVFDSGLTETSTMTASSVDTPILHAGAVWGTDGLGIGDIELNEYCSVHTPYDETAELYEYNVTAHEILMAASDYGAGTLGPLLSIDFDAGYGTIGYTDPYTGDTTSTTVEYVVSAANGWSGGYPLVDALTVQNSGTLSLQGGSIEFMDPGSYDSYYLDIDDASRLRLLYEQGTWVYLGYDQQGGMFDHYVDAFDIASLIDAFVHGAFLMSGMNYVPSGQSSLFSVENEYSYQTVFTGQTVEIGDSGSGSVYTIMSDSGVTAPSLELNDGATSVTLSPSELQQLKALLQSNP